MKDFLTIEQIQSLRVAHRKEKNKRLADRIKIILALNNGFSYEEIAILFLIDDETVRRYEKSYQEGNLAQLIKLNYQGSASRLSEAEKLHLKEHLSKRIYLSTREVSRFIYNTYGVKFSISNTRLLLKRLGFVYKKPHGVPGKSNTIKQQEFISMYKELVANIKEDEVIYFVDGVHPTHNTKLGYG